MNHLVTFLFILFISVSYGQENIPDIPVKPLTDELPFQFNVLTNGDILISGSVPTFISEECYLSKHGSEGNLIWSKIIGGSSYDYFRKTIGFNNSIVCGGNTNSFGQNFRDFYLVRFDQDGDTLWTRILGGSQYDQLMDVTQNGNNILLAGFSNSFGSTSNNDILLINTDSGGNAIWSKSFEASGEDIPHSIKKTEGGFIISGNTNSFGVGEKEIFVLKTDSLGNFDWMKGIGGTDDEDAIDMAIEGTSIYITGYTKSFSGYQDLWIIKMDLTGNLIWNRVIDFGLNEKGNKIFLKNDKIFICGYMQSMTGSTDDIFILNSDTNGNNISARHFELSGNEFGNFIGEANGKLIVSGLQTNTGKMKVFEIDDSLSSCSPSALNFDSSSSMQVSMTAAFPTMHTIPIDSVVQLSGGSFGDYGNAAVSVDVCYLQSNISKPESSSGIFVFPNPNSGKFSIRIENTLGDKNYDLTINNVPGEKIIHRSFNERSIYQIDISGQPNGLYFLELRSTEFLHRKKIIINSY